VNPTGGEWQALFAVTFQLPVGSIGATKEEATMLIEDTAESRKIAHLMARMFIVPDDLGTPAGAVTLRGAWNFQTPPGWDTVYTPIFNMIERPLAPMMVVRVETDWFVHDTEFRYVLQPGETISASHSLPIGQVLFVPREEITLRDGTEEEVAARRQSNETFFREKTSTKLTTAYGLEYSPHYSRTSRQQNAASGPRGSAVSASVAPPKPAPETSASQRVGRNAPCPCGSGRKYKKCHGESG
jgi:hypothetical protein